MMNPDPTSLDRLHDVIEPARVSWWPPAPAWYWIISLVAILGFCFILQWLLIWQRNRYRREALARHRVICTLLEKRGCRIQAVTDLAELLKRTALSAYPRKRAASLTGDSWLRFLDQTGHTDEFTNGPGRALVRVPYDSSEAANFTSSQMLELAEMTRQWIRQHEASVSESAEKGEVQKEAATETELRAVA